MSTLKTIAVLGGTGKEGSGLALRWALNGYRVIIGSRDVDRASAKADELNEAAGDAIITGMANADATQEADIIVLSVPYSAHEKTLQGIVQLLDNKILVDVTVPLQPPKVRMVHLPEGGSAGMEAQTIVGEGVRVVSAFQNVSAERIKDPNMAVNCDVLICGDDAEAKEEVVRLVEAAGMRGIDAGPLANAVAVEALTPVLLYINKAYKVKGAGIQITNLE